MNSEIKTISIFGGIIISAVIFLGIIFVGLDDLSLQNQGSVTGVFLNINDSGIFQFLTSTEFLKDSQ